MTAKPLPWIYTSPEARIHHAVDGLSPAATYPVASEGDVSLDEMRIISSARLTLILDARPEIFYRLGHIPSAVSLPRDDFESRYHALEPALGTHRNEVVIVYCSGESCEDSRMVGDALERLGYSHVRLFRGGWNLWQSSGFPEEKE